MKKSSFGEKFKDLRVSRGITLRAFCNQFGLDPGNISKLERGRLAPPDSEETLRTYAGYLDIVEDSDDWNEFFDLARIEKGRIPKDLLDDELVDKLPVLFRMMRGAKADGNGLDELIERIRKA